MIWSYITSAKRVKYQSAKSATFSRDFARIFKRSECVLQGQSRNEISLKNRPRIRQRDNQPFSPGGLVSLKKLSLSFLFSESVFWRLVKRHAELDQIGFLAFEPVNSNLHDAGTQRQSFVPRCPQMTLRTCFMFSVISKIYNGLRAKHFCVSCDPGHLMIR
jgi:hypothetical protein